MPLQYANLDHITRRAMVEELDEDIANGTMHISPRLQPTAVGEYQRLLRDALRYYDDLWLEERIVPLLVDFETRHTPKGEVVAARLPVPERRRGSVAVSAAGTGWTTTERSSSNRRSAVRFVSMRSGTLRAV